MTRLDLPSGGWVELRDPKTLRDGDRDDILRRLGKIDEDKPIGTGLDMATGLKLLLIQDWEIPYLSDPKALPVANPKLLRELTIPDADTLNRALQEARELLFPAPVDPGDFDDPSSPTGPANG